MNQVNQPAKFPAYPPAYGTPAHPPAYGNPAYPSAYGNPAYPPAYGNPAYPPATATSSGLAPVASDYTPQQSDLPIKN